MNFVKVLSLAMVVVVALSAPVPIQAQPKESEAPAMAATETASAQETRKDDSSGAAYEIGAGVATAVNIPLRGAICVIGGVAGFVVLVITFGSGYRAAASVVEHGCSGPWIITPEHLKGTEQPKSDGYK